MDYIKINPSDNVAVVLKDLVKGEAVEGVTLSTDVPRGHKVVMVNDDKPLIHIENDQAFVFGTPYNGKHRLGNNICVKLKAISVLERANENSVLPLTKEAIFPMLLQQCFRPSDPEKVIRTLNLLNHLANSVKLYKLRCNMDIEAAKTAYNYMK